jgi:transposase
VDFFFMAEKAYHVTASAHLHSNSCNKAVGNYRQEHLFSLKQAVELFEYYQEKIGECEEEMEKYLANLPHMTEEEPPELPFKEKRNLMSFNVQEHAYKMLGVDLFRIRGLNSETVLRIVSEVGVDLRAFPSEKHFASWLCLSPNRRVSGGKVLSSKTNPSSNRAASAFRQAPLRDRDDELWGAISRELSSGRSPESAGVVPSWMRFDFGKWRLS